MKKITAQNDLVSFSRLTELLNYCLRIRTKCICLFWAISLKQPHHLLNWLVFFQCNINTLYFGLFSGRQEPSKESQPGNQKSQLVALVVQLTGCMTLEQSFIHLKWTTSSSNSTHYNCLKVDTRHHRHSHDINSNGRLSLCPWKRRWWRGTRWHKSICWPDHQTRVVKEEIGWEVWESHPPYSCPGLNMTMDKQESLSRESCWHLVFIPFWGKKKKFISLWRMYCLQHTTAKTQL